MKTITTGHNAETNELWGTQAQETQLYHSSCVVDSGKIAEEGTERL